ncbi:MAG: hypothetical protein ACYCZY_08875 [Lacisediminihabitans sp.]
MTVKPKEIGGIAQCLCCGLPRSIYRDSPSAQQVCDECMQHHNRDLQQNMDLHRQWWLEYTARAASEYEAFASRCRARIKDASHRIEGLQEKLVNLTAVVDNDYHDAPLGDLQTWMQSESVKIFESKMRAAYRSRDSTMVALWRLDRLHGDSKTRGKCQCGVRDDKCKARAALAPILPVLDRWEARELERLTMGREHGLPRDHPEVLKRKTYSYVATA